ncbi:50S ribosomal protein L24 [Candidatus Hodgkinia cicadicola]|nr:50S ribosomal protein L24 [Candidatus Hodgkinia cicadicola]
MLTRTFNKTRRFNQRVRVLCVKRKRQIGEVARVVAKANAMRFVVCFEQLALVKVSTNCAVLAIDKLKKLSLS